MADLSQTAANVALGEDNRNIRVVQVGEAVTQGMPGYRLTSDSKWYQGQADTSAHADAKCIYLTPAAIDGYAVAVTGGLVNLGATLTVGENYVVSANKGKIAPASDLITGNYVTSLGIAETTALLDLKPNASGVAKP